jgi:hypothetical protein
LYKRKRIYKKSTTKAAQPPLLKKNQKVENALVKPENVDAKGVIAVLIS